MSENKFEIRNGKVYGNMKRTWKTRLNGEKDQDNKYVNPAIAMHKVIVFDGMPIEDALMKAADALIVRRQVQERAFEDLAKLASIKGERLYWHSMGKAIEDADKQFEKTVQTVKNKSREERLRLLKELEASLAEDAPIDEDEDQDEGNELGNE